jgi:hypothetical protein
MANWFCKIAGTVYGPYGGDDLRRLVGEGRLLSADTLRDGEDGEWFPAEEMENLFPEMKRARPRDEDEFEDDDFDRPRRRKSRQSGRPSNYYSVLLANLRQGGQWKRFLGITFGLQVLIPTVFNLIVLLIRAAQIPVHGAGAIAGYILQFAALSLFYLAAAFAVDVLIFGLVCLMFRVRINPRHDSVLDVFAFCYLVGLIPSLLRLFVSCGSFDVANYLLLVHPFVHGGVLVYLLVAYWGLPAGRAWALGAIRFGYQISVVIVFLFLTSNWVGIR